MPHTTPDLLQTHPALSLLRLAALSAGPDGMLDDETLELMFEQVETGALAGMQASEVWTELARGLMGRTPSNMFRTLYASGALMEVLPEVAGVFGVPQIADDPPQVDIGQHLLRVLDEAARCGAPLPVHYRHVERGRPRIEAMCERFGIPDDCRELALLALAECERVHRVGEVRAGPVAALLARVGAFDHPERYVQLMTLCACDYRAYGGRAQPVYPKAVLLGIALQACAVIDTTALDADALQNARAAAIASAFRSERWSDSQA